MDERIARIRHKFEKLKGTLSERQRRLWAGAEAVAVGRGGVSVVAKATGLARGTVQRGKRELSAEQQPKDLVVDRRRGAGRRRLEMSDPKLTVALERLVDPATRGDPEAPLRWTSKSTERLAHELKQSGHRVSATKVRSLLKASGYTLQGTSRIKEGIDHPERDAQFEFINSRTKAFVASGLPVISVDSKKRESVGEFANAGREWQRKGRPVEVLTYDFTDREGGAKATPYGIYDVAQNSGFVNVGTDHNTPTFAVRSIERWWLRMGAERYPNAKALFITADAGGSNSAKSTVWKAELQDFADRHRMTVHVSHFPPGTSKWNKIEHRLFSFITLNWRGRPLTSYETIVSLIAATTTRNGLTVRAELDVTKYPLGVTVQKQLLERLHLERDAFQGEWNYVLEPRSEEARSLAKATPISKELCRRANRSPQAWLDLYKEQKRTGLGTREFCAHKGLHYPSYKRARHRVIGLIRTRKRPTK